MPFLRRNSCPAARGGWNKRKEAGETRARSVSRRGHPLHKKVGKRLEKFELEFLAGAESEHFPLGGGVDEAVSNPSMQLGRVVFP